MASLPRCRTGINGAHRFLCGAPFSCEKCVGLVAENSMEEKASNDIDAVFSSISSLTLQKIRTEWFGVDQKQFCALLNASLDPLGKTPTFKQPDLSKLENDSRRITLNHLSIYARALGLYVWEFLFLIQMQSDFSEEEMREDSHYVERKLRLKLQRLRENILYDASGSPSLYWRRLAVRLKNQTRIRPGVVGLSATLIDSPSAVSGSEPQLSFDFDK
jgi:hypothetical protein